MNSDELAAYRQLANLEASEVSMALRKALDDPPFTPAERKEIAEYMIARWSEWAAIP